MSDGLCLSLQIRALFISTANLDRDNFSPATVESSKNIPQNQFRTRETLARLLMNDHTTCRTG